MPWQSSEYILGSEYARLLNMQQLCKVLNMPQYGWIFLSKMWMCLNMAEFLIIDSRVSHSGGQTPPSPPRHPIIFFELTLPPSKLMPPPIKLKREAPFHETISRKSTININLKSFKNTRPWHDTWAIALSVTRANQEKGGLDGQWKTRPNVKLRQLISPCHILNSLSRISFNWFNVINIDCSSYLRF